jgi:hypothetical protein
VARISGKGLVRISGTGSEDPSMLKSIADGLRSIGYRVEGIWG